MDQLAPSRTSTSAGEPKLMAVQDGADVHETLSRSMPCTGVASTTQLLPSHRSANVLPELREETNPPTAVQVVSADSGEVLLQRSL